MTNDAHKAYQQEQASGKRAGLAGSLNMHAPGDDGQTAHKALGDKLVGASTLHTMLDERGSRYGKFVDHAACTQDLKRIIYDRIKDKSLHADQLEALEMIAHKIGRIVCGDPDYEDSWRDIAGYATLVADRLIGEER